MRFAVVRQAVTAFATGAWDFTASGYGTCIGASFKISGGLSDITPTNGARMGLGFTDGTNSRAGSWVSQNGQATTVSRRRKSASHCLLMMDPGGGVNGSAAFDSFITDGIRLNIDDSFATAFFVEARLYFDEGGESCKAGSVDMSSGTVDVTSLGFQFSFLEGFSTFQATAGASADNAKFTMGFAVRNPSVSIATQNSFAFYEAHGAADGAPSARADSAYFLREIEDASVLGAVQIEDVDSDGFTATQVNSAAFEFYYLAVKCNNQVKLNLHRSADATGTLEHAGPAFTPIAAFGWNSKLDTLNSNAEDGRAGSWGVWQTTGASSQFNSSTSISDGAATTDCQSVNDDAFPYLPDHDGGTTTAIIGSVTGFTASGLEINYTNVDSVRCYFAMLSIRSLAVTPGAGSATFNAVDPSVVLGGLSIIPAAASALMLAIAPSVLLSGIVVTPTSGTATFTARAPVVELSSVTATPTAGAATFLGAEPTVAYGSTVATPGAGSASFLGVDPSIGLSSMIVTPPAGSAQFLASDPTVDAGVPTVLATVTAYETRVGFNYLHGNVPVPDDWVETSLFLRDPDGVPLPTEQHIVERGPSGNTRVLELRARGSSLTGGVQTFSVEEGFVPADPGWGFHNNITINIQCDAPNTKLDQSIVQFSSQLLRGEPSTGNSWDVTRTVRRFGQLQSSSGSPLFGYEAFVTTVAGEPDVWLFEMTVQNGNVGTPSSPLGSNALHDVFFNEIRLDLSADYDVLHLIPTPYTSPLGAPVKKLMTPNGDGTQHFIEVGGSHEYRFVVYHTSKFARASVLLNMFGFFVCDFSKTRWSWNNRKTAWFGPRGSFVAEANLTNYLPYGVTWAGTGGLAAALLAGNPIGLDNGGGNSTPMGPFHARGQTDPGPPSGVGVIAYVGHEVVNGGSINKLKTLMAIESMDRDRQSGKQGGPLAGISLVGNDQAPIDAAQWNLSSCYTNAPGKFSQPGPFNRAAADQWRLSTIGNYGGLPGWYGTKMNFGPHSYSHYIRGLSATFPLIWLRNDPLAKSYLRQMAAWGRIRNFESGLGELWSDWSGAQGIQALPGKGAGDNGGRYAGWPFVTMAVDYQIGTDTKRTNYVNWYTLLITTREQGQFPYPGSGNWHASVGSGFIAAFAAAWTANGNDALGPPPSVAGGTSIEISIQGLGLGSWDKAIGSTSLRNMLSTACRGMRDYHWLPGLGAPCFISPVRPTDKTLAAYTQQYVSGDPYGTPGGEAPDIFPLTDSDNYQIPHLILAGLKADPSHAQAWSAIYTALGESTVEGAISDLFAMITSDKLKWTSGWNAVLGYLQDVTDNTFVVPLAGSVSFVGIAPDLTLSSTTAEPAPAIATFLGVDPTVHEGDRIAVPDPAIATFLGADPTVSTSGVAVTPAAAVATFQGVAPAVVLSSMVVPPDAGSASFLGVDPSVTDGGRIAPLEPAIAEFLGVDPAVTLSSTTSAPDPAQAMFLAVDPTAVFNSFTITPEVGVVTFLAEDPAAAAPVGVTPPAGVATFRAVDPGVIDSDTALVSSTITLMGNISTVLATLRGKA